METLEKRVENTQIQINGCELHSPKDTSLTDDDIKSIEVVKVRHCKICQGGEFTTMHKGSRKINICYNCKEIKEPKLCLGCERTFTVHSYKVLLGWIFCAGCLETRKNFKTVYSKRYQISSKLSDIKKLPKLRKYIDDMEKLIHDEEDMLARLKEMNTIFLKGEQFKPVSSLEKQENMSQPEKKLLEYQELFNSTVTKNPGNNKKDNLHVTFEVKAPDTNKRVAISKTPEPSKKPKVNNVVTSPAKKVAKPTSLVHKPSIARSNRKTTLSDDQIKQIKECHFSGITRHDICEQFHIGSRRLNSILMEDTDEEWEKLHE